MTSARPTTLRALGARAHLTSRGYARSESRNSADSLASSIYGDDSLTERTVGSTAATTVGSSAAPVTSKHRQPARLAVAWLPALARTPCRRGETYLQPLSHLGHLPSIAEYPLVRLGAPARREATTTMAAQG
jgi:hypothetical protein